MSRIPERKFLAILAASALLVFSLAACGAQKPEVTEPAESTEQQPEIIQNEPEKLPPERVEMPNYALEYSGELKDLIVVKQLDDQNALEFYVKLTNAEAKIFTMNYGSEEGDLVITLKDPKGEAVFVAFQMDPIPEGLSEADHSTYCTAQEAVNDIVASLVIK